MLFLVSEFDPTISVDGVSVLELSKDYITHNGRLDLTGEKRELIRQIRHHGWVGICSLLGVWLVRCIVAVGGNFRGGQQRKWVREVLDVLNDVVLREDQIPGLQVEVLYGVSGMLVLLKTLYERLGDGQENREFRDGIRNAVIPFLAHLSTVVMNANDRGGIQQVLISFPWHQKHYVGAAHGISGILHALLLWYPEIDEQSLQLRPSIDLLLSAVLSTGITDPSSQYLSFPSSIPDESLHSSTPHTHHSHQLTQWCHGTPGIVPTLKLYQKTFPTNPSQRRVTDWIQKSHHTIHHFGVLKKRVCLCHGIAGNGYAFFPVNGIINPFDIQISLLFGLFGTKWKEHTFASKEMLWKYPSEESLENWGLFEGLSGAVCFWRDLLCVLDGRGVVGRVGNVKGGVKVGFPFWM